jgi:hypothetical protein
MNLMSPQKRRDLFRKSMAESGVPANEAELLDKPLGCHFTGYSGETPFEADWRVLSYDSLQGCAEIYLAEMFLIKRRIYEAGDNLRAGFELSSADLLRYLSVEKVAPVLAETINQLFLSSLSSSFTLNVNGGTNEIEADAIKNQAAENQTIEKPGKTVSDSSKNFKSRAARLGKRVESWISRNAEEEGGQENKEYEDVKGVQSAEDGKGDNDNRKDVGYENDTVIYRLRLADYWLDWQRTARLSKFDFDHLQTISEAGAVRFYEMTKLWRVPVAVGAGNKLPAELEIEYEKFAALLPLPVLHSARDIKLQIGDLIEPLKGEGKGTGRGAYIESFTLGSDHRDAGGSGSVLVFRFND